MRESIGEVNRVESLGPGARDYRVSLADGDLLVPGTAWSLTRALQAHRDIADAESAIDQPGLEPPPGTLGPEVTPAMRPRDFKADQPLPCEKSNPEWSLEPCRAKQAWTLTPPTPQGRVKGAGIVVGQRGIWSKSPSGSTVDVTAPGETVWVARPAKATGQGDDVVDVSDVRARVLTGRGPKKRGRALSTRSGPAAAVPCGPVARLPREGSRALLARLA